MREFIRYIYIYIHIYGRRRKQTDRQKGRGIIQVYIYFYICVCMYICKGTKTCEERDLKRWSGRRVEKGGRENMKQEAYARDLGKEEKWREKER